jgi:Arylsulfotransferase (ASST)
MRARAAGVCLLAVVLLAPTTVPGAVRAPLDATHRGCRLLTPRFHTHPDFRPVRMCVWHRAERSTAAGQILLTPWHSSTNDNAAIMLTRDGRLLWYRRYSKGVRDLKVVRYRGRPALAYFTWGHRAYSLLDRRYREVRRIKTRRHLTDMHELAVTPQGTAYIASYHNIRRPRTHEWIRDYMLQEIDLATHKRVFEWNASDHVPLSASYEPRPRGKEAWDFFHGNSIEPPTPRDPTLVVSARNTSAVYGIDRGTGRIRWILGGKQDQFGLRRGRFCAQHDVRRIRAGITMFDNGLLRGCGAHAAQMLRFRLEPGRRRAQVVQTIPSSAVERAGFFPWGLGSARRLPGGHVLVSWGNEPYITEHTPGGRVVFGLRLRANTYRAVRARWEGRPADPPAVAARRRGRATDVWASWNGATDVHAWLALAGSAPNTLRAVRPAVGWSDFETRIRLPARFAFVAVRALDRTGQTIGRSATIRAH